MRHTRYLGFVWDVLHTSEAGRIDSYVHRAHLDYNAERNGIAVTRAGARRLFELFAQ